MVYLVTELRAPGGCPNETVKGRNQDGYSQGEGSRPGPEEPSESISVNSYAAFKTQFKGLRAQSLFSAHLHRLPLLIPGPWSQIQTVDLLFVNVGFIHCQLRDGRKKQVMHSPGLAPTLRQCWGRGGRTQSRLQYPGKMPEPRGAQRSCQPPPHGKQAPRCPPGSHRCMTSGCTQAPLLTRPTAGPGGMALTKQLWDKSLALVRPPLSVCKWG